MAIALTLEGVFAGTPQLIGDNERQVWSAIRKRRVTAVEIALDAGGLDGDRQADLVSHGGLDKAVYAYPSANYDFWSSLDYGLAPGGVGENLAVAGPDEHEVRIGDIWAWGQALLQVSQPRTPCYKLALHTGRKEVTGHMIDSGRCGWYLRVLRPGSVPTHGTLRLVETAAEAPTVHALFTESHARGERVDPVALRSMIETPALGGQWRDGVLNRLRRMGAA
jgi:MOSC domain-containing protein YiiM